ncbi:MAG TPA: MotA/TolQ/ExbB proton channel family protein [Cyclobacteriaceae bacterium]|nr:MotA/TolQ/ExbB proton channel family protein [Cytophagales bacterium]HMR57524.1 MotA/TolQ/ExbB proton channel family protein [Cyclobacteriaceae bacterium]HRE68597.1 MotA/TolQ/ExbB proton channel family protein [Cyclobacteriaceae bacterium]HRF34912.1 MotA/TolQ/ExbB proton channel family protein [Cyclobacteriaceae bacterium]
MMLAQIVTGSETATTAAEQSISMWSLVMAGGPLMIPLAICSVIAIYIFVERVLTVNKANVNSDVFMGRIKELVQKGDINGAKMVCAQHDTPIARMIEKGVSRIGSPLKTIEASIENVGKIEVFRLEKNLSVMATIAGAAPMIGFLGTVIGMVRAFIAIAQEEGSVSPKLLADGIYTAMVTTVAGLVVGIIAYLGYNYLVTRVSKVIHKMEYSSIEFIDLLQEPR